MTTLTSGLSWTIGASTVQIEAKVYATNSDGTSAAKVHDSTINYQFVP